MPKRPKATQESLGQDMSRLNMPHYLIDPFLKEVYSWMGKLGKCPERIRILLGDYFHNMNVGRESAYDPKNGVDRNVLQERIRRIIWPETKKI